MTCRRVSTILLGFVSALSAHAFEQSYSYELLKGKDQKVCRHMADIFNSSFKKPWSGEHLQGRAYDPEIWRTWLSRYPTSPEFEKIAWKAHKYLVDKVSYFALYADLDLDNDGDKELVMKLGFFQGSPGSRDSIYVFPSGAIDFASFRTHQDFLQRFIEKRITVWDYPVHQRPFIYDGRTYIYGYEFTPRTFPGANAEEPFGPPEYAVVNEYKGPAKPNERRMPKRGAVLHEVCKFDMIQG